MENIDEFMMQEFPPAMMYEEDITTSLYGNENKLLYSE